MVYHCRSFKSAQELKSAMLSQRSLNNYHKRFMTEVLVNGGVALKTQSSVVADISSMFVNPLVPELF